MLLYCHDLVMLVVGLIDIQHMQSVIKVFFFFFFFFLNCYYFSDRESQWQPRNPELKWDFACLQQLSEGVSHNIEGKKSQLCFRTIKHHEYNNITELQKHLIV